MKEKKWDGGRERPVGEQATLVSLVPQVLVQIRVGDLFHRVDVVHGDVVVEEVHELQVDILEGALGQQVPLDAAQRLVRVVIGCTKSTKSMQKEKRWGRETERKNKSGD